MVLFDLVQSLLEGVVGLHLFTVVELCQVLVPQGLIRKFVVFFYIFLKLLVEFLSHLRKCFLLL
jgi:hypothetical protein